MQICITFYTHVQLASLTEVEIGAQTVILKLSCATNAQVLARNVIGWHGMLWDVTLHASALSL